MQIIGSTMTVNGRVDFEDNNAESVDGGALYLTSYGQVVLQRGAQMNFIGNRGRLGSAIVVEAQNVVNALVNLAFNPQCFLRYGGFSTLSPLNWKEVCKVCNMVSTFRLSLLQIEIGSVLAKELKSGAPLLLSTSFYFDVVERM